MLEVKQDKILVNGSAIVRHDCTINNLRPLLATLYKLKDEFLTRSLEIMFSDGEPIKVVGFDKIIKDISQLLNLPPSKFLIITHDKSFQSEYATIKYIPSGFFQFIIPPMGKYNTGLTLDNDAKLFGLLYGRYMTERFLLSYYASTKLHDESFVVFHPTANYVTSEFGYLGKYFKEELDWISNWSNVNENVNANPPGDTTGPTGALNLMYLYEPVWPKFKIEIVSETDSQNPYWITEKTTRCLFTKKPFLLLGGQGSLENLRKLGFKTFDGIFNESYDREPSLFARMDLIKQEMSRIYNMNKENRDQLFVELEPILQYNQDHYQELSKQYYKSYDNSN